MVWLSKSAPPAPLPISPSLRPPTLFSRRFVAIFVGRLSYLSTFHPLSSLCLLSISHPLSRSLSLFLCLLFFPPFLSSSSLLSEVAALQRWVCCGGRGDFFSSLFFPLYQCYCQSSPITLDSRARTHTRTHIGMHGALDVKAQAVKIWH